MLCLSLSDFLSEVMKLLTVTCTIFPLMLLITFSALLGLKFSKDENSPL